MAKHSSAATATMGASNAGKSLLKSMKLKIGGAVLAVVFAEWVVAYMFLRDKTPPASTAASDAAAESNPDETAPPGENHDAEHAASRGGQDGAQGKNAVGRQGEQEEVDLGEFTVTAYQPVSNSTLFISFHLYGTILHKHSEDFTRRLTDTKFRIRDNVIVIIRSAEIADLTDAGLGLIKRRILETTNKALGKAVLQSVMFSDFSFVEQ